MRRGRRWEELSRRRASQVSREGEGVFLLARLAACFPWRQRKKGQRHRLGRLPPFLARWGALFARSRVVGCERQLPEALLMLAAALRAGHSFLQAAETVSREVPAPLGPELARFVGETRVGLSLEEALRRLGERVGSRDLDLAIAAVMVQRETGGNLAQVVERVAETIRERLRLRGEILALTAQGRLSGMVIGVLPLALGLLLWWLNPAYLGLLFRFPGGRMLLAGAGLLAALGFLLIQRLIRVDI